MQTSLARAYDLLFSKAHSAAKENIMPYKVHPHVCRKLLLQHLLWVDQSMWAE